MEIILRLIEQAHNYCGDFVKNNKLELISKQIKAKASMKNSNYFETCWKRNGIFLPSENFSWIQSYFQECYRSYFLGEFSSFFWRNPEEKFASQCSVVNSSGYQKCERRLKAKNKDTFQRNLLVQGVPPFIYVNWVYPFFSSWNMINQKIANLIPHSYLNTLFPQTECASKRRRFFVARLTI